MVYVGKGGVIHGMDASSDIFSVVQLLGATRWHATEVSLDPLATVEIGHWFIGTAVSSADADLRPRKS